MQKLKFIINYLTFYLIILTNALQISENENKEYKSIEEGQQKPFLHDRLTLRLKNLAEFIKGKNNGSSTVEIIDNADQISKLIQKQILSEPILDLTPITQNLVGGRNFLQSRSSICRPFEIVVAYLINQIREFKATEMEIFLKAVGFCEKILVEPGVTTRAVCMGFLDRITATFHYIISYGYRINSNIFVSITLQVAGCSTSDEIMKWDIPVEKYIPEMKNLIEITEEPSKYLNIVHLTDIHLDPLYTPNANALCPEKFLCCRSLNENVQNVTESQRAGYWGDYRRCATPIWTFVMTIKQIAKKYPNAKIIFLTGDFICQMTWMITKEFITNTLTDIIKIIEENFPKARIVFSYGAFDTEPTYQYVSTLNIKAPRFELEWNFKSMYVALGEHIPSSQEDSFINGGYYAVEIDETLKIISLNTNFCNGFNMWILFLYQDPAGQLRWLLTELQESEEKNQLVYLIGHIPPGNLACDRQYSRNFYRIMQRYRNTIKAQWYGFTHNDEFKVFYDPVKKTEPISSAFITGSLTSYRLFGRNNPGYKIFYVDGARGNESSWNIIDYEAWIFDLEKANSNPKIKPKWFKLYTAREAMDIPNLSHKSLSKYLYKIARDSESFDMFHKRYSKLLNTDKVEEECDAMCRKLILCSLVQPFFGDFTHCKLLDVEVDGIENEREDSSYRQTQMKTKDLKQ